MTDIDTIDNDKDKHDQFIRSFMSSVAFVSRASNKIPTEDDYAYFASYKEFVKVTTDTSLSAGNMIQRLLQFIDPSTSISLPECLLDPALYDQVVDTIDALLDEADRKFEAAGESTGPAMKMKSVGAMRSTLATDRNRLLHGNQAPEVKEKPQKKFLHLIDNHRDRPFKPILKKKHNEKHDLYLRVVDVPTVDPDVVGPSYYYAHPYETELNSFAPTPAQLQAPATPDTPYAQQPFEFVDTPDHLLAVIDELSLCTDIAVDLEHHSFRSFLGLTCLMQISSRTKDYIIDALALRSELQGLDKVFANDKIVKVFHGCDQDILWLQRDLGLYVVNCFDTYQAAKLMKYPSRSLAHLIKLYCGVTISKKHQLSDWRIRKLPDEMIAYAKSDTHYLLSIYDCMRQDLWTLGQENALKAVIHASTMCCLSRYEKPMFWPLGYRKLIDDRSRGRLGIQKIAQEEVIPEEIDYVLGALYKWRDDKAREEDESLEYIMSNSELLRIGMRCPTTVEGLQECGPLCEYVASHAAEIVSVMQSQVAVGPVATGPRAVAPTSVQMGESSGAGSQRGRNSAIRLYGRALVPPVRAQWDVDNINGKHFYSSSETICTFTPSVGTESLAEILSSTKFPHPGSHTGLRLSAERDALRGDILAPVQDINLIFREAGWVSTEAPEQDISSLPMSIDYDNLWRKKAPQPTGDMQTTEDILRLTSIRQEIVKLAKPVDSLQLQPNAQNATNSVGSIPTTVKEIFAISNRNKSRVKEKKRGRDGDDDEPVDSSADMEQGSLAAMITDDSSAGALPTSQLGDRVFDPNAYFLANSGLVNRSTEETVNFALNIGWVADNLDRDALLEEHELELERARQAEVVDLLQMASSKLSSSGSGAAASGLQKQPNLQRNSKEKLRPGEAKADKERSKAMHAVVPAFEFDKVTSSQLNIAELPNSGHNTLPPRHRPSPTSSINSSAEFKKSNGNSGFNPYSTLRNSQPPPPSQSTASNLRGSTPASHPPGHRYNR